MQDVVATAAASYASVDDLAAPRFSFDFLLQNGICSGSSACSYSLTFKTLFGCVRGHFFCYLRVLYLGSCYAECAGNFRIGTSTLARRGTMPTYMITTQLPLERRMSADDIIENNALDTGQRTKERKARDAPVSALMSICGLPNRPNTRRRRRRCTRHASTPVRVMPVVPR